MISLVIKVRLRRFRDTNDVHELSQTKKSLLACNYRIRLYKFLLSKLCMTFQHANRQSSSSL